MTFRDVLIRAAVATLGWREDPPGANDAPFIRAWLEAVGVHRPAPWCAAAVYAWHQAAADALQVPNPCPRTPGSLNLWALCAESQRHQEPAAGDVAVWRSTTEPGRGHVALVEYQLVTKPGWLHVIGGNSNRTGARNGIEVAERDWEWTTRRMGSLELVGFAGLAPP